MPNARTHQTISACATTVALTSFFFLPPISALAVTLGSAITCIPEFSPDLDIAHRRFGTLGEFIGLKAYARSVPHRAGLRKSHWSGLRIWNVVWMSHIPLLGTLPRTVILTLLLFIAALILDLELEWPLRIFFFVWLGMSWSDLWHVIADLIGSDFKEFSRSFWRHRKRSFYRDRRRKLTKSYD